MSISFDAVTSVRIASFLGLLVGPLRPLDRARSTSQTARSSRAACVGRDRIRGSFRLKLASSLRLRGSTHFVPLAPPPVARRQLQTEATTREALSRLSAMLRCASRTTTPSR